MNISNELQKFIDKTAELAKADVIRRGKLEPRIFLFFQSDGFCEGMLIPNSSSFFTDIPSMRLIPKVIDKAYNNMINIYKDAKRTLEIQAVVMVTDVYIETIDQNHMPEPGTRRASPFIPAPNQQEAISISVYEKDKTYCINWLYTRTPNAITFNPIPEINETKHIPGTTRLGDLWPVSAR